MALVLLLVLFITATAQLDPFPFQEKAALAQAKHFEPIEILILESPLTQIKGQAGSLWGLDTDRLADFAKHTGLKFKILSFKKSESLIEAYRQGRGQIVISRTRLHLPNVTQGPLFEEIKKGLYCRKQANLDNLDSLRILKSQWPLKNDIKKLQNNEADCFYAELQEGDFATQAYLTIKKVAEIPTQEHYTWIIRSEHDDLKVLLHSWYRKASRTGQLQAIEHRFRVSQKTLSSHDIRRFYERITEVLPQYLPAFKEISAEIRLPWPLVAAVAYQESQWNHAATSFTGVKGLMQLTLQTADHMGVSDREDPYQSIWGGARYIKHLWQEWPEIRNPKDRMMVTLASYNIGIAHMYDVIEMLKEKGVNPYQWSNIEAVLPSLEDEAVYSNLHYGYARGTETVDFVNRTYSFYQLLSVER